MDNKRNFFCLRGYMKSGTNWLGGLLDRHPHVSCRGEYHWEEMLGPYLSNSANMTLLHDESYKSLLIRQMRGMIRHMMQHDVGPEIQVVGDRTPHEIAPVILHVPHISIIRDGRDILVSRAFHLFNRPDVTKIFKRNRQMAASLEAFQNDKWFFRNNPERLLESDELVEYTARWWVEHLESDRRTVEKYPDLKVRFLKYESLLKNTQSLTDELFEFIGVDPSLAPPIEGKLEPGFKAESPDKFFRKGESGDWVNYFTDRTKEVFKGIANDELVLQGYVQDADW
ncbi:MAG: sulfotransferase domain-containing protein [Pirellulaceae bacterium]